MSIYGHDTRILDSWYRTQDSGSLLLVPTTSIQMSAFTSKPTTRCFFLELPLELRRQIYQYALPKSIDHPGKGITWLRGSTALLATSSQIHEEASTLLYGDSMFVVDVIYDCTTFICRWLLPNGLMPQKRLAFPENIGNRYLCLIRRILVNVHHIDDYTGMIKYNYSESGLRDGLRDQVRFLCQCLARIPEIRHLSIRFQDDTHSPDVCKTVLEPFSHLDNVKTSSLDGDIEEEFGAMLLSQLESKSPKTRNTSFFDLPLEMRQHVYKVLLDSCHAIPTCLYGRRRNSAAERRDPPACVSLKALGQASHALYSEVQSFIFATGQFHLRISQDLLYELETHGHLNALRPIMSFPDYIPILSLQNMRYLTVHVDYIGSSQLEDLEVFLTRLVKLLEKAPLRKLVVRYVSPKKRSSGHSPSSTTRTPDPMASYIRSLDMAPHMIDMRRRTASSGTSADTTRSNSPSSPGNTILPVSFTSSPTTITADGGMPSGLIQTPAIAFLLSKFNPILAQVKARNGGIAGFHQVDTARAQVSATTANGISPFVPLSQNNQVTRFPRLRIPNARGERDPGPSAPRRRVIKRNVDDEAMPFSKVPL